MKVGKLVSRNTTGTARHNITVNTNIPNFGLMSLVESHINMEIGDEDNISQPTIISCPWSLRNNEKRLITPNGVHLLPKSIHGSVPKKSYTHKNVLARSANCSALKSCNGSRSRSRSAKKNLNLLMKCRSGSMSPPPLHPGTFFGNQNRLSNKDNFDSRSNLLYHELQSNLQTATSQLRHLLQVKQQEESISMLSGFG